MYCAKYHPCAEGKEKKVLFRAGSVIPSRTRCEIGWRCVTKDSAQQTELRALASCDPFPGVRAVGVWLRFYFLAAAPRLTL